MINQLVNNSTKSPAVSVIMNCLNSNKYLREAIDSVFAQTYADWEIVFWDNASNDNSTEIAKSYGEKVRCFRGKETVPLGKARNRAIQQAGGRYIAFLDCDDIWLPEKLEKQIYLFEKKSNTGLVFCNAIYFSNKELSYRLYGKKKPPDGWIFRKLFRNNFLCLSSVVIRRDTLDSLNEWFDERFNMSEDADLFMRIAHDYESVYVDEPLAKRRMHRESWSVRRKELFPEEIELILQKFHTIYDNFGEKFKQEILLMKSTIEYQYALLDWEKGRKKSVRQRLYPYLRISKILWVPYILSFLPYEAYRRLKTIHKRLYIDIENFLSK